MKKLTLALVAVVVPLLATNIPIDAAHVDPGVTGRIDVSPPGPFSLAVNRFTNRIYTTSGGFFRIHTVSVIDGDTDEEITTIVVDPFPRGVAVNPNTNRIYVGVGWQ